MHPWFFSVGVERSSINPKGFKGAFFLYQLNVQTFNCHHRTDRRVEGLLRRVGGAEGWAVKPRFYKDKVFKVGGRRDGWVDGLQKLITFFSGWAGFAKVDNRFG